MKFGIYYTHYECLGHTSRVLAVISLLNQYDSQKNIFCIQAGSPQSYLSTPDSIKTYSLKGTLFQRKNFYQRPQFSQEQLLHREQQCLAIIHKEQPDVLFTEYFPLGRSICRFELMSSLSYLFHQKKPIYSMAGYPLLTREPDMVGKSIIDLYRGIFIHSPQIEKEYLAQQHTDSFQRRRYLDFFKRYEEKIFFTNYLMPKPLPFVTPEPTLILSKKKMNVLVLRGGGAYCPRLIAYMLQISDLFGEMFCFTIVAGPATTAQEWGLFQSLMDKKKIQNTQLLFQTQQYESLIQQADICVSSASYHTSLFLMKYKKRAIVIPIQGSKEVVLKEQVARSQLLKDFLGCIVIEEEKLTKTLLEKAIYKAQDIRTDSYQIPEEWFLGQEHWLSTFIQLQKGA